VLPNKSGNQHESNIAPCRVIITRKARGRLRPRVPHGPRAELYRSSRHPTKLQDTRVRNSGLEFLAGGPPLALTFSIRHYTVGAPSFRGVCESVGSILSVVTHPIVVRFRIHPRDKCQGTTLALSPARPEGARAAESCRQMLEKNISLRRRPSRSAAERP
jgi:hypothetical protein